ncbi:unnamed protein product, partial [Meganyctiphanes norvegica]
MIKMNGTFRAVTMMVFSATYMLFTVVCSSTMAASASGQIIGKETNNRLMTSYANRNTIYSQNIVTNFQNAKAKIRTENSQIEKYNTNFKNVVYRSESPEPNIQKLYTLDKSLKYIESLSDLPEFPGDVNCISYNLMTLECRWSIGSNQTFNSALISCDRQKIEKNCSCHLYSEDHCCEDYCCTWTGIDYMCQYEDLHFILFTETDSQNSQYLFNLSTYSYLLPDPPQKFQIATVNNCSVNVNWDVHPSLWAFTRAYGMMYHLEYRISTTADSPWQWREEFMSKSTSPSWILEMPYPGQDYDLRLRLKAPTTLDDDPMWWSQPTNGSIVIQSQVPWRSPNTTLGSFEISYSGNFIISWKTVSSEEYNGPDFKYVIKITEINSSKVTKNSTANGYYTVNNYNFDDKYEFEITSRNDVGECPVSSEAIIVGEEGSRPSPPQFRAAIKYWDDDLQDHIFYQLRWQSTTPGNQSYSVFWCNDYEQNPGPCQGKLNWKEGIRSTTLNLSVYDLEDVPDEEVHFAV